MKFCFLITSILLVFTFHSYAQQELSHSTWRTTSPDGRFEGTLHFMDQQQVRYIISWYDEEYRGSYQLTDDTITVTLDQSHSEQKTEALQPVIKFMLLKRKEGLGILGFQEYDSASGKWKCQPSTAETRYFKKQR